MPKSAINAKSLTVTDKGAANNQHRAEHIHAEAPMPVIMPMAESPATANAGQRRLRRMASALLRSITKNRMKIAEPENSPRQNSSVSRPALIARVKRPADDQARAAIRGPSGAGAVPPSSRL
jgi:hypothetical protein